MLVVLARYRRFIGETLAVVSVLPTSFFVEFAHPSALTPYRATQKVCFAENLAHLSERGTFMKKERTETDRHAGSIISSLPLITK